MFRDSILQIIPILVIALIILTTIFIYVRPYKKKLAWLLMGLLSIPTIIVGIYFTYLLYLSTNYYLDGHDLRGRKIEDIAAETKNPELCEKIKLSPHQYIGGTGPNPDKMLRNMCYERVAIKLHDAEICKFISIETYGKALSSGYATCVDRVSLFLD